MLRAKTRAFAPLCNLTVEDLVPADHFYRHLEATLDLDTSTLTNRRTGAAHGLRPLGDAGPVIAAGGLFAYARKTGMIPAQQG